MSRLDDLLKYLDRKGFGLEVAPYFNPAVPKSAGHRVLILDVFDTETLRKLASEDPNIPANRIKEIEEVDIVSDASNIASAFGALNVADKLDFIVSSHNFEHLPNPIKFLRGCSQILAPGGVLSMAVPDYRACIDHFRMPTRLSDWLAAYRADADQPDPEAIFDFQSNLVMFHIGNTTQTGCDLNLHNASGFQLVGDIRSAHENYLKRIAGPSEYGDIHCSTFFPESLELMARDLHHLGIVDLEVIEVSKTKGHEFFIHLKKPVSPHALDPAVYNKERSALLRKISQGVGAAPFSKRPGEPLAAPTGLKRLAVGMLGWDRYTRWKEANRKRRARRKPN